MPQSRRAKACAAILRKHHDGERPDVRVSRFAEDCEWIRNLLTKCSEEIASNIGTIGQQLFTLLNRQVFHHNTHGARDVLAVDDKFSVLLNYSPAENGLGAANSVRLFFTCEDAPKGILADAERLESSSFLIRVPAKKNRSARRMLGNLTHELVHVVQTTHHNIRWKCYCDRRGVACTHHGEYDTADDAVSEELLGDDCLHHGPYFQAWVRLIHDRFDSAIPGGYPDMMLVGDEDLGCAAPPPPRRLSKQQRRDDADAGPSTSRR